jgi:hypothetical protein
MGMKSRKMRKEGEGFRSSRIKRRLTKNKQKAGMEK